MIKSLNQEYAGESSTEEHVAEHITKRINLHQEMMSLLLAICDLYQNKMKDQISCLCQSPNILAFYLLSLIHI